MIDRNQHIAQKKKELLKIAKQQMRLITKAAAMIAKPSKYQAVNMRRLSKMIAMTMQVRALEMQKQMIIAQSIPKINGFLPGGPAIIGESGRELIITNNGNTEIK